MIINQKFNHLNKLLVIIIQVKFQIKLNQRKLFRIINYREIWNNKFKIQMNNFRFQKTN